MAAMLFLVLFLVAGCNARPEDRSGEAASNGSGVRRSSNEQAAPSSQLALRDYVLHPQFDPADGSAPALRLVSAAPNLTEICSALGLRGCLVGRTRYCTYPPSVESVPVIGALNETRAEDLLGLRPDLVLVSGTSRAIVERLEGLDLRYVSVPDTGLADLAIAIRDVAAFTDREQTASRLNAAIEADLGRVTAAYRSVPPARVLLLIGTLADPPQPPFVAGPGSFYDDLLRRAGHENVADTGGQAFAPLALEYIVRADPDVIIELDADGTARPGGEEQARALWRRVGALGAVRENRIRVLAGPQHFLLGPRVAQTYAAICRAVAK